MQASLLKFTAVQLPYFVIILYAFLSSRKISNTLVLVEVGSAVGAFSMALGLSEGTTQFLKLWIQRRRPSFYDLCGFNVKTLTCTGTMEYIREANFSFPSGHSSISCCGMTFLVLYFGGKLLGKGRTRGRGWTFLLAIAAWGWSIFVAGSRLVDNWHHPSDILAGLALGFVTCAIAYHVWYPPLWSTYAGMPRVLLQEKDAASNKLPTFNE